MTLSTLVTEEGDTMKKTLSISTGAAVMTCGGGGSAPAPYVPTPPATQADESVTSARDSERRRRRALTSNTFLTSGLTPANVQTGTKTLLGQ
jgi:hypothetical protein